MGSWDDWGGTWGGGERGGGRQVRWLGGHAFHVGSLRFGVLFSLVIRTEDFFFAFLKILSITDL